MNRNILAIGITILFLITVVTPMTLGLDVKNKIDILPIIRPPENSVICGYITDKFSQEPIENASVELHWNSEYINRTFTDDSGFYYMNTPKGSIDLYVDAEGYRWDYRFPCGYIGENETKWKNISKIPLPPNTSIVCGYVIDGDSQKPIYNAYCLFSYSYYGVTVKKSNVTDNNGFYKFDVPAIDGDDIWWLRIEKYNYFTFYSSGYYIEENETIWKNVTLYPFPHENSFICGYIKNFPNGKPIEEATVGIYWYNEHGDDYNETMTNDDGFFKINVAKGEIELYIYKEGYYMPQTFYYAVEENEIIWFNYSLLRSREVFNIILPRFLERFPMLERLLSLKL